MGVPGLRQAFDRVERAVGAPLEGAVASPRFGSTVGLYVNGQRMLDRAVRRRIDGKLAGVLHLLNIPTRDDVQRLSRQLAVLTSEVRALSLPADRIASYVVALQERDEEIEPRAPQPVEPLRTKTLEAERGS